MAETAKGVVKFLEKNKFGFWQFKIGDERYGLGTKTEPKNFKSGDTVEFSFYLKNDKYPTVQGDVTKVAAAAASTGGGSGGGAGKDGYWEKKDAREITEVQPRITYLAAVERAIGLVELAQRLGAYPSLEKAKPADKLGQIRAYVAAEADVIFNSAYSAKPPKAGASKSEASDEDKSEAQAEDEENEGWEE